MKRAVLAMALTAGFLVDGAVAQTPPDDKEPIPPDIVLQTFPPLVAEKVPQVRTYKFFLTENQIVVVSPQNIIADIIK